VGVKAGVNGGQFKITSLRLWLANVWAGLRGMPSQWSYMPEMVITVSKAFPNTPAQAADAVRAYCSTNGVAAFSLQARAEL